jgi:hypothetical protein
VRRRLVGNFPQAFSHIGLINTAHNIVAVHGPAQQHAEGVAPRLADAELDTVAKTDLAALTR